MTSSTARSGDFQDLSSLQRFALSFDRSGREDFLDRMARLDAARDTRPADSTPPHDDDALVLAGRALDEAWALEVHALILAKRARNAEATAAAQAARQATARIVQRIEAAARELDYVPNSQARALSSGRTPSLIWVTLSSLS